MMTDDFAAELEALLNKHSQENASDTPDFILAEYLTGCLLAWNKAARHRDLWHGHKPYKPRTRRKPRTLQAATTEPPS